MVVKKTVVGWGLVVLLVVGWLVMITITIQHPPWRSPRSGTGGKGVDDGGSQIAEVGDPYTKRTARAVEVLEVRELEGKTYLVFKMDFDIEGPQDQFGMGGYFLGLRLVEQKWGDSIEGRHGV